MAFAQSSRPTVSVFDLDFGSVQQWWSGNWDIGKGIADPGVNLLDFGFGLSQLFENLVSCAAVSY